MKGVARIWFRDGSLLLPARSSYDQELLFEHLDLSVKRHGQVGLELNHRRWTVSSGEHDTQTVCSSCRQEVQGLTFAVGARRLCLRCGKQEIGVAGLRRLPSLLRFARPSPAPRKAGQR
jgi:hypothetical protein